MNYLYRDRVRERVSGRVTDRVRVRVRHPDSSGNLLIRHKIHYARDRVSGRVTVSEVASE